MAYQYLHRAMVMRYDTRYGLLLKKPADPIPAYDNWRESTTIEDVERLHGNAHALHMEGLAVRERVLGRGCPDLPHPVVFRGAVFADEARFDRCLALWRHALQLRHHNKVSIVKDLLRFAQVFSQMIHIGIELPLNQLGEVRGTAQRHDTAGRTSVHAHVLCCDASEGMDDELIDGDPGPRQLGEVRGTAQRHDTAGRTSVHAHVSCCDASEGMDDELIEYVSIVKDLLRFAQVFSQMIHIGIELPLNQVCFVLEACAEELKRGQMRIKKPQINFDPEALISLALAYSQQEEYESNVRTALYLVAVAARLLEDPEHDEESRSAVRRAIFGLRSVRLQSGQTLLHLAADRRTPVDDFHTSDVCHDPGPRQLGEVRGTAQRHDTAGRTSVHAHVSCCDASEAEEQQQWGEAHCAVARELLAKGAHVDAVDADGLTPLLAAMEGPAESLVRSALRPRLSCLAAAALAQHRRQYRPSQVPRDLHDFLTMHGVTPMK
ncbi:Protein fem-1-like B [Papilio machaon]|uniref:Protein fem-1-like B n=1 Tax=Papilio machaon TaxID=76193 RepID=A0A194QX48_PAPMA|nr:Protein fem-1-like B [Papilio machaon]